jgi:hypothetical protein
VIDVGFAVNEVMTGDILIAAEQEPVAVVDEASVATMFMRYVPLAVYVYACVAVVLVLKPFHE